MSGGFVYVTVRLVDVVQNARQNPVNDTAKTAVALYPELQGLLDLRSAGWMFSVVDVDGELTGVKGMRLWRTQGAMWADIMQIHDQSNSLAVRLNPLREKVWIRDGDVRTIVDLLIELPHPDAPNAPRSIVHGAVPFTGSLWTPEQRK